MKLLIKNGRILDPATGTDRVGNLLVEDGKISAMDFCTDETKTDENVEIIQASGCYVMPGLVDLHVHLREPGFEYKETIETGCKAAINGGFTTIFAMPNLKPVADTPEVIRCVEEKGKEWGIKVHQVGAITKGQAGAELADLEAMFDAGCIAISEEQTFSQKIGSYKNSKNTPMILHASRNLSRLKLILLLTGHPH